MATPRPTKRTTKFQFLPIIWKTKLVTYPFYCIFRKCPKFFNFSGDLTKIYSVELKLYWKSCFLELQKVPLKNCPPNISIWIGTLKATWYACEKSGWVAEQNLLIKTNVSCMFYLWFVRLYAIFSLPVLSGGTFTRNFDSLGWHVHSCHVMCRLCAQN